MSASYLTALDRGLVLSYALDTLYEGDQQSVKRLIAFPERYLLLAGLFLVLVLAIA